LTSLLSSSPLLARQPSNLSSMRSSRADQHARGPAPGARRGDPRARRRVRMG
jgi:hypothetical protein